MAGEGRKLRVEMEGGRRLVGAFVQSHDPASIELLGHLGFDFLCVEGEHSAMGVETIRALVAAAELTPAPPLVRVAGNDPVLIAAALDAGAQGVVVPRVDSGPEAAAAVASTRYPPDGARGLGPGRAAAYGRGVPEYLASANAEVLLAVQVETRAAVDDLDAIFAVDGVDMIFVGPGDLGASLGIADPRGPELLETVESILRRAKEAGRLTGIFAADPEAADRWRALGTDLVVLGSDMSWMAEGVKRALGSLG
jgi:4-hydroxy-2-oxoheptanedioate aldolase